MKQLRSFFTVTMIAVMLVGALDANAKTKRSKTNKSKSKTTKTTKTPKKSHQSDYDLEFFQQVAKFANMETPIDCGEGIVVKSITMEGTKFCFNYSVTDDELCEMIRDYPDLFTSFMKSEGIVKDLRNDMFDDDGMLDAVIRLGITFNFRIYAQGEMKPLLVIPITGKEMKNI
ncbi:MAG: hypothetical protein IKW83_01020 [Muribaculaceae bacterium]|nr:hypothetical protein [Muribaculaceae bacterium]